MKVPEGGVKSILYPGAADFFTENDLLIWCVVV